jgi:hypothetical protein
MNKIEQTTKTPLVCWDKESLLIEGISIPENSYEFYAPIHSIFNSKNEFAEQFTLNMHLDYFNTSSSKELLNVMNHVVDLQKRGCKVSINWRVAEDDEEMMETGRLYEDILKFKFDFVVI